MTYVIAEPCIDCAACETVCPLSAIFFEDDVPEKWKGYTAKNKDWFRLHETGGVFRSGTERR